MPQWKPLDFLISRHNLATSIGEVLKLDRLSKNSSFGGKSGAGLSAPGTLHFEAKNLLKISLFLSGSEITLPSSIIGGINDTLFFLINLLKIENFFFEEMLQLCIVEETLLKKFFFALVFALVDCFMEMCAFLLACSLLRSNLVTTSGEQSGLAFESINLLLIFLKSW